MRKAIPIIVITWALSLATTIVLVYFASSIFPPLGSQNIADEAIITTKLADGTVTSAKILDGTITAQDVADNSIIAIKIADGAVTTTKIADSAVTTAKIADNAVVTVKLADNSITSAKIMNGAVTAIDLADAAVTSIKIADGSVTTDHITDYAITNMKLAPNAIPYAANYSITSESTTSTSFTDMPDMKANITLTRTSHLIIMFSAEAWADGAGDSILMRALVDTIAANPDSGALLVLTRAGIGQHGSNTFIFYLTNVNPGTHTIKIQWTMLTGMTMGHVADRTLNIIALPA